MDLRNNLLFNKNEAKDMVLHKSATAPSSPAEGQTYFNTNDHTAYTWNGTVWSSGGGGIVSSDSSVSDIQTLTRAEYDALTPAQKANKMWMTTDELDMSTVGDTMPIGIISAYPSDIIPDNWLLCNGQAVSRTTYSLLFAVIGTSHGAGDGSTTFNIPNIKSRTIVGKDSADTDFDTLGETLGSKTETLTISQIPSHDHDVNVDYIDGSPTHGHGTRSGYLMQGSAQRTGTFVDTSAIANIGGGGSHNNIQPSIVENYIIKAKYTDGILPQDGLVLDGFGNASTINAGSANNDKVLYEQHNNETWQAPTFSNGWVNYAGGFQTAGYYKHDGRVYLRGLVKSGTMNTAIFTLPVGYRPTATELFAVESNQTHGRLNIDAIGDVTIVTGSNVWVSLSGVSFRID